MSKTSQKFDLPWDAETLEGLDVSKNESKAASYSGFTDLADFRKYQCSHPFLNLFLRFEKARPRKGGLKSNAIFRHLSNVRDSMETTFGDSLAALDSKWPLRGPPGRCLKNSRELTGRSTSPASSIIWSIIARLGILTNRTHW